MKSLVERLGLSRTHKKSRPIEIETESVIALNALGDNFSDLDLTTGTLVLGAPGSGKSRYVGRLYRREFLTRGYGGIILTVKKNEAETWLKEAKEFGRGNDVIHVTKGGLPFDPLTHETGRGGGGGDTPTLVSIVSTLGNVGRPHVVSNGDEASQFFRLSTEQAEGASINLLKAGGETVSVLNMRSVINSLPEFAVPENPLDHTPEVRAWLAGTYAGRLLTRTADRRNAGVVKDADWRGAEYAADFLCNEWPVLAPETRTSIKQTFSSLVDKLITPPYDEMLCSGRCAYVPEQTFAEGKIILLDLPTVEHGKSAELLQIAVKIAFQGAIKRRNIAEYPRPCFLYADEFQVFCVPQDGEFQEICRENRGCVWYATQNLQNIAKRLHEHTPGAGTLSLIGNIGCRIFLQNGETEFTNRWAADNFGKFYATVIDGGPGGVRWSQQERYRVHPNTFIGLRTPGADFPYTVGVVYRNGQPWPSTGEPYLIHAFPRL